MADWLVPLSDVRFSAAEVDAVAAVYGAGWLSQGLRVAGFESDFADFVGSAHAVAVASGTAALHLGLVAGGVGAGDEVVLPSLTFAATAATVIQAGATPVFAECSGPQRPWLSSAAAEAAISSRTRAIVNVAYGGHPGNVIDLKTLADARGLTLIEDAAHAVGARVGGRSVGTVGHVGAYSFFANKNLHLGEGGMLVTGDGELAARVRRLRSHGLSTDTWARHQGGEADYDVIEPGFNYRLDEPRAALGRLLLGRLPADNERRARLAGVYADALKRIGVVTPVIEDASALGCSWHIYPVLVAADLDRAAFRAGLAADGVQTSVHYPPLHLTTAFERFSTKSMPFTEDYARRTVTLPLFPHMTSAQQSRVLRAIERAASP